MKAFVPAKDSALSKRFYEALGFARNREEAGLAEIELVPARPEAWRRQEAIGAPPRRRSDPRSSALAIPDRIACQPFPAGCPAPQVELA
jgi:hypothetical protein